jgi:hypothetical protein
MLTPVDRLVFEFVHRPVQDQRKESALYVDVVSLTAPPGAGFVGLKLADTEGGLGTVTVKLTVCVAVPAAFVAVTVQLVAPTAVVVVGENV